MRGVSYPLSLNFFKACTVMFMVLNGYHGVLLTKLTISERGVRGLKYSLSLNGQLTKSCFCQVLGFFSLTL